QKSTIHQPHTVVTTLDKGLQQQVEQLLKKEKVEQGAVVVQDIQTGNVFAMASTPGIEPGSKEMNPWHNQALIEATPGSIFKIVVAIAALSEGLVQPDTPFSWDGYWEDYRLRDAQKKGHGKQTFSEAFANSCNIVFGKVAAKLGGKKIQAYAQQLGLAQPI